MVPLFRALLVTEIACLAGNAYSTNVLPGVSDWSIVITQDHTTPSPSNEMNVATVFLDWHRDSFWRMHGPNGYASRFQASATTTVSTTHA